MNCSPIIVGAINLGSSTIIVDEVLALYETLIWAKRRNLTHVMVEGDSKLIIDAVWGTCEALWNLRSIIEDIRWCATSFFSRNQVESCF